MIADFLAETAQTPFEWGENDCALWCAALVLRATGEDPASRFRGSYSDWMGARNLLLQSGGLANLCKKMMKDFPTGETQNGVAVVRIGRVTYCGVLSAGRIVLKSENCGMVMPEEYELIEGWSLCRKH
ncbi:hypothetical protein [Thalassobius sp. I31.1]|uniref:DUF6950 family protein n=1 Tax=Thalassobius sp. I31.1 TaxID=2109912 RepID=UPI000D1BA1C1|nr:hypothetical protein [Thalassobius sp. I31.1]